MEPGWNTSFIVIQVLVVLGSMVQGSLGFGLAVVASPIFILIDPRLVPVTLLVNALVISVINAWQFRQSLAWRELTMAFVGRIPGTLLAVYLLSHISHRSLSLIVGISVLLAVVVSSSRLEIPVNRMTSIIAGFFSGLMGTSSGIGGPPMAILYQKSPPQKARANLSLYFVVSCIFSLLALAQTNHIESSILQISLSMIPAALLGTWLAKYPLRYMHVKTFRRGVLALCSIAAIGVLVTAFKN